MGVGYISAFQCCCVYLSRVQHLLLASTACCVFPHLYGVCVCVCIITTILFLSLCGELVGPHLIPMLACQIVFPFTVLHTEQDWLEGSSGQYDHL